MRLQSKKLNPPLLSPIISVVFLLSLVYWLYLALTTRMNIVFDAIGYESLGRLIETKGWIAYFSTGPNREPLYPLLIAVSMHMEHIAGFAYQRLMAMVGVIILFATQVLTYKILRLLNIRTGICALVLAYFALSPALNNSAFSLFSEIATYPFLLGIILASFYAGEAIKHNKYHQAWSYSMLLGILLTLVTLVKAVFECIAPVYLFIFFLTIFLTNRQVIAKRMVPFILCITAALILFYGPISGFKYLNLHYNGNYVVTNRGAWLIYGNTARRMGPLTLKKLGADLAFVPGQGVCNSFFSQNECAYWSFSKSDVLGNKEFVKLSKQHLSNTKINSVLLGLSIQEASHNPLQYSLLAATEGLKMFFWESTQIGFVSYPRWLGKIYDIKILNDGLRFILSLLTMAAVLHLWMGTLISRQSHLGFLISILIFIYIFFFSFVCTLTRYALPIAPLYLIAIGIWLNQILAPKEIK